MWRQLKVRSSTKENFEDSYEDTMTTLRKSSSGTEEEFEGMIQFGSDDEFSDDGSTSSFVSIDELFDGKDNYEDYDEVRSDEGLRLLELPEIKKSKKEESGSSLPPSKGEFDVGAYMNEREMTPFQEKVNAVTIIPNPLFCFYFILSGKWLISDAFHLDSQSGLNSTLETNHESSSVLRWPGITDSNGCIHSSLFPNIHALPPLPILAIAIGITLHAPFSFIYHWKYASKLPPGFARIDHWSRRLDHAFIHVASACLAYGTSGSWDYFLANAAFNIDCIYRQFKRKVRPRRNKVRIYISFLAYLMPLLKRGEVRLFVEVAAVFAVSAWLFALYPIGGWSHSLFHVVMSVAPPLMMAGACHLTSSQDQIAIAAQCATTKSVLR